MDNLVILMLCHEQMHVDFSFLIPSGCILIHYQAIQMVCTDEMEVYSKLETSYLLMLIDKVILMLCRVQIHTIIKFLISDIFFHINGL